MFLLGWWDLGRKAGTSDLVSFCTSRIRRERGLSDSPQRPGFFFGQIRFVRFLEHMKLRYLCVRTLVPGSCGFQLNSH